MRWPALLLLGLIAAAPQPATVRIGALEAVLGPDDRVEAHPWGLNIAARDVPWRHEWVQANVHVSETAPCGPEAMTDLMGEDAGWRPEPSSRVLASGLTLHWLEGESRCRAMSGAPVAACVRHEGVTTTITALGDGCRMPISRPAAVVTLLLGLRPTTPRP